MRQFTPEVVLPARRGHEQAVLGLLRAYGPLNRGELSRRCGLSRTTLHDTLSGLLAAGAVVTATPDEAPRGRGRPAERLALNPAAGQALGIDFSRRAVYVAAVDVTYEIVGTAGEAHAPGLPWPDRVALAERLVRGLLGGGLWRRALKGVGVGVVGPLTGAWDGSRDGALSGVAALLGERFGGPVLLDNNTRLAALAESTWGAAAGDQDALYLRLSYGVGGGVVAGGVLHRGADGVSGEIGHVPVDPAGRPCECGGTGCLETVASIRAVLDAYRARGGQGDDLPALKAAVEARDPIALGLLSEVGGQIGRVLAALSNAIGPRVIVVGGELAELGAPLLEPVRKALDAGAVPISRHRLALRRAALGGVAGALGGVALALGESPLLSRYPAPEPEPEPEPEPGPAASPADSRAGGPADSPVGRRGGRGGPSPRPAVGWGAAQARPRRPLTPLPSLPTLPVSRGRRAAS
ncbi:ROK family transcriptional regulator [Microbispora rosea]|uniref:ROK family transcriptional regulator n=1 Tax=Microbispora rosea TaxID=58117 RepID=UPI000A42F77A|nr:ROK family protein [Microbispora rosea]